MEHWTFVIHGFSGNRICEVTFDVSDDDMNTQNDDLPAKLKERINEALAENGCESVVLDEDDLNEMVDGSLEDGGGKIILTLPKRFSCPKHGFAV